MVKFCPAFMLCLKLTIYSIRLKESEMCATLMRKIMCLEIAIRVRSLPLFDTCEMIPLLVRYDNELVDTVAAAAFYYLPC